MFYYAQLNENGVCTAILETESEETEYIRLEEYDMWVLGKKYENGQWSEPVGEPTDDELINAELLLNQADILVNQNVQDEVLAELLLGSLGV